MATIAGLVVEISANAKKFHSAVQSIQTRAKRFAGQLKTIIGAAVKTVVAGATAAAAAVTAVITQTSLAMRDLVRDAEAVGATAQDLQTWQYAAQSMGVEADKVGDIFKDMQDKIGDFVRTGGGEAADVFEQLGLNAREFIGLSPDQSLLRIGQALEGLSQGEKIFFMESIADDASRLLPLLDDNAERFEALAKQGREWGTIMTEGEIKASAALGTTLSNAKKMATGFKNLLGANLAPTFQTLLNWLQDLTDGFGGPRQAAESMASAIKTAIQGAASAVESMIGYLKQAYSWLLKIQEFQYQAEAFGSTVNRIATGNAGPDSEVPEAFNRLQENRRKQAELESGGSVFDAFGKAAGDLSGRLDKPASQLSDEAIRVATNIGILANASRDTAEAMVASRNTMMQSAQGGGVMPTGDQQEVPGIATPGASGSTGYTGLNLSSIAPMSQDEVRARQAANPSAFGSSSSAAASGLAGQGGAPKSRGSVHVTVTDKNGKDVSGEVEGDDQFISRLANVLSGVAAST